MQDHETLRQYYANLEDEELLELALQGAETLRPEALELLQSEVSRRRLGQEVQEGIDAQLRDFTPAQQAELVDRFRQLPCPLCGAKNGLLNAFPVAEAKSFVVVTTYREWLLVGCPQCIQQASSKAYRTTVLLGWWGIPWGLFRTLQALGANNRARGAGEHTDPTPELLEYVRVNRGNITALMHASKPSA
jgi:hypothetical protein